MRAADTRWDNMFNQLLEFKQKYGHVKVPARYNENKKLGVWVTSWRNNYREYKRTNGQKGDPVLMQHWSSLLPSGWRTYPRHFKSYFFY
jgi:hypothetical protein